MPEILADPPWYIPTLLAIVALVVLAQGNARQHKQMKIVGLAIAGLAVAIFAVGHFLESGRETVTRKTKELAAAVDGRKWDEFAGLLDPKVRFFVYNGRDQFRAGAEKSAEAVGVKNITVSGIEVKQEPGSYIVDFAAMADIDIAGRRVPTNWRFYWGEKDFLLYRIDYIGDERIGTDAVFSRLVRP